MGGRKKYKTCEICDTDNSNTRVYEVNFNNKNMTLCQNHYYQMRTHGKILDRTRFTKNEIIEHDGYCEMLPYDKDGNITGSTIFSKEHVDLVKKYKWSKVNDGKTSYASAYTEKNKSIRLHQLIAENLYGKCPKGKTVDHANLNGLDNLNENLSYKDYAEQQWNKSISKNNTSGHMGVGYDKERDLWVAEILSRGKKYRFRFKEKEDAINKRKELEIKRDKGEL